MLSGIFRNGPCDHATSLLPTKTQRSRQNVTPLHLRFLPFLANVLFPNVVEVTGPKKGLDDMASPTMDFRTSLLPIFTARLKILRAMSWLGLFQRE
jgi:hypothetical protein